LVGQVNEVHAALQIAWSENHRPFVTLYRFLDSYETEFIAWAFIAVALLSWNLTRRLGMAASSLALIAIVTMYWGPSPVTHGDWVTYADDTRRLVFDLPTVHNTPALAITLFIGGMLGSALLVFRRQVRSVEAFGCLLLLPLMLACGERAGRFWYPLDAGFFPYWYWMVCVLAGIGLACLFWSIPKRIYVEPREVQLLAS
jgi:hypothetical protein